jgi:cell division protein FtsZ
VEQTPTYKRTREILDSINTQAVGDHPQDAQEPQEPQPPVQGVIKFG